MSSAPPLDLDAVLDDPATRVVVCCGSGGVGKTTTAAALGLRAAERGRAVVVLTIDPAPRLAQSMGLERLDDSPRPVEGVDTSRGCSLRAAVLDMKRTFDTLVETHASPERAEQVLANPFYQSLSSSLAGTQEYMAMERLGQLRVAGDAAPPGQGWDLVVVDTPPSRSALDFLDAPARLGSFLDSRLLRVLAAPARAGGRAGLRVASLGLGAVAAVFSRVVGAGLLTDLQAFVGAFETVFGGFRQRAEETYRMLAAPGTAFVVVAAPERDALREATFFVDRLARDGMPLAGVVVNRTHPVDGTRLSPGEALYAAETAGDGLVADLLRLHAERGALADREDRLVAAFRAAHPGTPLSRVRALAEDVHDLAGLRQVGELLAEGRAQP